MIDDQVPVAVIAGNMRVDLAAFVFLLREP